MARSFLVSASAALAVLSSIESVSATPNALSLDLSKVTRSTETSSNSLERRKGSGSVYSALSNNQTHYEIGITLGTPPQYMSVVLDTGSSDLWVLSKEADACPSDNTAACPFESFDASASKSFKTVSKGGFNITYFQGEGDVGDIATDTITLGSTSVKGTFGLVHEAQDKNITGIFGVGFASGESTISSDDYQYSNFLDLLYQQGAIAYQAFSLWLNSYDTSSGTVVFGGIDTSKYTGDLVAIPIKPNVISQTIRSYDVPLTSISFSASSNSEPQLLTSSDLVLPATLDSGSSAVSLPFEVIAEIYRGLGAVTLSPSSQSAVAACSSGDTNATLDFQFAGSDGPTIRVPISEFLWPLKNVLGGVAQDPVSGVPICQLGIIGLGNSGSYILGDTFLRSAYVVYDVNGTQIAIAQANDGGSIQESNIKAFDKNGVPGIKSTATGSPATALYTSYAAAQTDSFIRSADIHSFYASGVASPTFDFSGTSTTKSSSSKSTGSSSSTATSASGASATTAAGTSTTGSSSSASSSPTSNAAIRESQNTGIALLVAFGIGLMI